MSTIDRHIWLRVIRGYALMMAVLLSVFSLMAFVSELDSVGRGTYTLRDAVFNVLLTVPSRMIELAPATAILGSIIGLGELASGHELIAMLALGTSPLRIGLSVTVTGIVLMIAVVGIQEWVAPSTDQIAYTRRIQAISNPEALSTKRGFWSRDGRQFIRVHQVLPGRVLSDVEIYEFDDHDRLRLVTWAAQADPKDSHQWVLLNVVQRTTEAKGVATKHLASLPWAGSLTPAQVELLILPAEILSRAALGRYITFLKATGQDVARLEIRLWQQLTMPLSTLMMVLVAIPFVLGPLRKATAGKRILHGSLVGAAFHLGSHSVAYLGAIMHLNAALTVLSPLAVLGGVTVWVYRRAQ
ncbi:LPS export ABC transporter permease LptG [Candidatus Methylomirabilis sp.]|uniref:LPS export ABC transporter permease LptG n=1 Tax=Candidatus Methylomirabilis sp. TaxID=2032687 RepID=UPI002A63F300|nr:LPS export ABC transporter permease LptG [Candidatus Methylomirabilis sp.]